MRTDDVKRFIYTTKRNLSVEDVRKIISTVQMEGKITKDRTSECYVYHNWKGTPPFPKLPEDAGLVFKGKNPGSFRVGITIPPKAFKEDPSLGSLTRLIAVSELRPKTELYGYLAHSHFKSVASVYTSIVIGTAPFHCTFQIKEKSPTSVEIKRELLASLFASGGWPVSLAEGEHAIAPNNLAGGTAVWQESENQVAFTWPEITLERIVAEYARTLSGPGIKATDIFSGLGLPDDAEVSWRKLNQYLQKVEQLATPSTIFGLSNIEWSLNGYEAFPAMVAMQAALEPDSQIITKMFGFDFAGQSGFMELGHEKSGFCAWFSFDDEKPFKALQKAIGFPLKSWG